MNAFRGVELDQVRRGVVWVQLDLVDGRNSLARWVAQELLEVLDAEI